MINLACSKCKLVWTEQRELGEDTSSAYAFACPRCGTINPVANRQPQPARPSSMQGETLP